MLNYTIENFWRPRLAVAPVHGARLIKGWSFESRGLETFTEAPLGLSNELSANVDPMRSALLLVSAPGAVGKSTLARQLAFATGAVYIDLANADPVGGNTVSGGLARSGLYSNWEANSTTVLIDGLDEARLRVTQEAFESFLADVAELAKPRTTPIVLFGRTGAVQDAWLILSANGIEPAVLEIGYYDQEKSVEFAEARLRATKPDSPHQTIERRAIELLLERLRNQTESDGDRFAGYAPVLQAVADRVAQENNPNALIADIEKGAQPVTLQTVASAILERERSKLRGLSLEDGKLADILYRPQEQLDRIVARLYGLQSPSLPQMAPKDAQTYSGVLSTWVAEHPFLDGGHGASSAVFDAIIAIHALKNPASADVALQRQLDRGAAANPFLSEFYLGDEKKEAPIFLLPDHVGIVYTSLRARLSLGDSASLTVEGRDDGDEEETLRAEVEITLARRGSERPRIMRFSSEQTGVLRLGAYLEDVEINAPHAKVEIGPGPEAVLIAPISIQCQQLNLTTDKVVAESPAGVKGFAVYLEASNFEGARITSVPAVRGSDVSLAVSWPGARRHPWTSFATEPTPIKDPRIDQALRRFRKFVVAFRSHSKGNLARYRHKIEHERMTKDTGQAILDLMVDEQIMTLDGSMYLLDPVRLGTLTGATYADCMARRFSEKTIAFAERALGAPR